MFNEIPRRLFIVPEMIFGDKCALTAALLIFREHEHAENIALCRVFEFAKDFSVRVEFEARLVGVRLV